MVSGCALETDVCHWMFKTEVNMVQSQEDAPLSSFTSNFLTDLANYGIVDWFRFSLNMINAERPLQNSPVNKSRNL